MSEAVCRWCAEGNPEWSFDARVWIHRREKLDRKCERPPLCACGAIGGPGHDCPGGVREYKSPNPRMSEPLTMSAEREAEIRKGMLTGPWSEPFEIFDELDAERAAHKRTQEALEKSGEPPTNEAWISVLKYAYADGGDGALNIYSITSHYIAMRKERDAANAEVARLKTMLGQECDQNIRFRMKINKLDEQLSHSQKALDDADKATTGVLSDPNTVAALSASLEDVKAGRVKALDCVRGGCEKYKLEEQLRHSREVSTALAKALKDLSAHIESIARESYLEDKDADPELFEAEYEDADHEQWQLWQNARAAIALAERDSNAAKESAGQHTRGEPNAPSM